MNRFELRVRRLSALALVLCTGLSAPGPVAAQQDGDAPDISEVRVEVAEDCLAFEPASIRFEREGGGWLLSSGNSRMMLFENREEAATAVRTIRHYRMDTHCYVGRPDASMEYFLVGGAAPEGSFAGEDCLSFDANALRMRGAGRSWTLVDGNHTLMAFPNGTQAQHALRVIRKHSFSQLCFVGRPDPSMTYFRK